MLAQVVDAGGQKGDLHLRRAGVFLIDAVFGDEFLFVFHVFHLIVKFAPQNFAVGR